MKVHGAYDSIFGDSQNHEEENFMPAVLPMTLNRKLIETVMNSAGRRWVLVFVIGTKPCFYKFYGSIIAAQKANVPFLIVNSNQHYDDILTHGIKEFNFHDKIAINLSIRGDLAQKSAELMIKISWLARYLKKKWGNVTVVPIVLGDTIMTSIVPAAWMFSRNEKAIQNEAGLRSMTPIAMKQCMKLSAEKFIDEQFNGRWMLLRNEPFPEQWDTYTSAAGSQYHFAPVELNKKHLLREGYPKENIWVIGGVVVDALQLKRKLKPQKSIFSIYPQLEKGRWIRVDIHRRENLTPRRFKAIIGAIKELVQKGFQINFIEMSATRMALNHYGLREEIEALRQKKNFLHTNVWPEYGHVIEFFESEQCMGALTDSGGVQEELNLIGKVCMTCRLSTDRPETVFGAKSNVLVPGASKDIIVDLVEYINKNQSLQKKMSRPSKIYGNNVGKKFIDIVSRLSEANDNPFKWSHDALGLWRDDGKGIDYL